MPAGRLPAFEREQRHLDEPGPAVPAAKREDIGVDLVGRAAGEADPGSLLGHGRVAGPEDDAGGFDLSPVAGT